MADLKVTVTEQVQETASTMRAESTKVANQQRQFNAQVNKTTAQWAGEGYNSFSTLQRKIDEQMTARALLATNLANTVAQVVTETFGLDSKEAKSLTPARGKSGARPMPQ
jgi:uncharacterized protein YukE